MERGEFITCKAPYGYRLINRNLIINDSEAEIVRRIFKEYLGGKGMQQIANGLTSDQVEKRSGSTVWYLMDVARMLKNEKYAGEVILQKRYTTDTLPFKQVRNRGEVDQYHIQNTHPPIISKEEFDRAQTLAEHRAPSDSAPVSYPFTKKAVCAHCGATLKRIVVNGKVSWTCYRHYRDKELCPAIPIPEPHIQDAFVRMWNKLLQNRQHILSPLLSGLRELEVKFTADPALFSVLNREIAELTGQSVILNQLRAKGYLDDAMFTQQIDVLNGKLDILRLRRRALMKRDDDNTALADTQAIAEIMENAEPLAEFCGDAFCSTVEKVIADNGKLRFRLKGGLELFEYIHGKGGRAR